MIDVTRSVEEHLGCALYAGISGKEIIDLPWDNWDNALQPWERRRYLRGVHEIQKILREILPRTSWRFIV